MSANLRTRGEVISQSPYLNKRIFPALMLVPGAVIFFGGFSLFEMLVVLLPLLFSAGVVFVFFRGYADEVTDFGDMLRVRRGDMVELIRIEEIARARRHWRSVSLRVCRRTRLGTDIIFFSNFATSADQIERRAASGAARPRHDADLPRADR